MGNGSAAVLTPAQLSWDGSFLNTPGVNLTGSDVPENGIFLDESNVLGFATDGTAHVLLDAMGDLSSTTADGWALFNASASATQPTLLPNSGDSTTGIGAAAAGALSEIVGSAEIGRWTSSGLGVMLAGATPQGALALSAAAAGGTALSIQALAAQTGAYACTHDASGNVLETAQPASSSDPRVRWNCYNTLEAAPTNYERGAVYFDNPGNLFRVETQSGGTGTQRALALQAGGGRVLVGGTADDGATALQVTGGASISKNLNYTVGTTLTQGNVGAFPAGVSFGNVIRAEGALDASGTSNVVGLLGELAIDGSTGTMSSGVAFRGNFVCNGTTGTLTAPVAFGGFVRSTNAMVVSNPSIFAASPQIQGAGNWTGTLVYYIANPASVGSSGDVTGGIRAFYGANVGRAAATTVDVFYAADQTKGSGNVAGFHGAVAAGAGKYNILCDGSAQNALLGNTAIGVATSATSKLLLGAGTATANTAPLQFTAGVVETTPRAGVVEYDGSQLYLTPGSAVRSTVRTGKALSTVGVSTYGMAQTDSDLVFSAACTVTLVSAATYPGREIWLQSQSANAVVSASANIVPLGGGSAGTAILPAASGKWARLVSTGSAWQIMAAN